jgi:hypothetical protein
MLELARNGVAVVNDGRGIDISAPLPWKDLVGNSSMVGE